MASRLLTRHYMEKDTFIHRLNPMTKILLVFLLSVPIFFFTDPIITFVFLMTLFIIYRVAQLPKKLIASFIGSWGAAYVIIWISYFWSFRNAGEALFTMPFPIIGSFPVTDVAIVLSVTFTMRLMAMITVGVILYGTTNERELLIAFRKLKFPYIVSFTFALGLRILHIVNDDFYKVKEAQMARAVEFEKGNPLRRLLKYVYTLVPLIVVSLYRISTISNAIESKAFTTRGGDRTFFHQSKLKRADYAINILLVTMTIASFILRYVYGYFTAAWFMELIGRPTDIPLIR